MTKLNLKNPRVISLLDSTKEELVAKLLITQAKLNAQRKEGAWLDTLANEMRDCANRNTTKIGWMKWKRIPKLHTKEFKEEHKKQNKKTCRVI